MQISVVADDYGQITKALSLNQNAPKKDDDIVNKSFSNLSLIQRQDGKQDSVYNAIQEWKNFCHQQILKGKLDIIA